MEQTHDESDVNYRLGYAVFAKKNGDHLDENDTVTATHDGGKPQLELKLRPELAQRHLRLRSNSVPGVDQYSYIRLYKCLVIRCRNFRVMQVVGGARRCPSPHGARGVPPPRRCSAG